MTGFDTVAAAQVFAKLMARLGYTKYFVQVRASLPCMFPAM